MAAGSAIAYWNHTAVPDGSPAGHANGSGTEPTASVTKARLSSGGNGTSTPPLNGAGADASATWSAQGADGLAFVSVSAPGAPAASEPVPTSSGVPLMPAHA